MRLKLVISPKARRDIREEAEYLEVEASEHVADHFFDCIRSAAELLERTPDMGRIWLRLDASKAQLRTINLPAPFEKWMLFYSITSRSVRIERLLHGARDLRNMKL